MPIEGIDFEGNAGGASAGNPNNNLANQQDKHDLNGGNNDINVQNQNNNNNGQNDNNNNNNNNSGGNNNDGNGSGNDNNNGGEGNNNNDNSSTGDLEPGTEIEFDGNIYTISETGDLVDKDGNVFKEKDKIADWLKENNVSDSDDTDKPLDINAIRETVGIDITDDSGKSIEFTNDAEGVKNYINSVLDLKSNEIAQGAVNKLFTENPTLKEFVDYVKVTGTPRGFGEIPDRSGIKLDKDNQTQQEAIIRMAAEEFGNKSLNESYIKYLRESGGLYDVAKEQLEALVGKDKAYRKEIEDRAEAMRQQEEKDVTEYWNTVNDIISKRIIGGYKLPDSVTKEINGKKITLTPDDFYKYVANPAVETEDGVVMSGYQRDLNNMSKEEALNKELLDAWLMFTGGSYKDLIDMAVKEDKVRRLVIKSKEHRSNGTVKINKPKPSKVNPDDLILS